uniref:NADH-ubiquinone oxidoreductase chain 5 n=1 Tax=Gephyromantis klemmeri TaxID=258857 RepID=B2DCB0_9NEOB|nr:NADH dehydrogenase subunit 5 [Gephyromantis klemmeri]
MHLPVMTTAPHLLIALILLMPLVTPNYLEFATAAKEAVKYAFAISLIPLLSLISQKQEAYMVYTEWVKSFFSVNLNICLDTYAITFLPVALFVTWSILEFSLWYMESDIDKNRFIKYLLIFLMAMIVLVTAGNFFTFFIGWEGVGLMSFLLIGWFHGRNNAAVAAAQAILYNRVGDIGFLAVFCWLLDKIPSTNLYTITITCPTTLMLMLLILAAATKSAQFTFHPWLASAMEGPTPVSALLHSSTMVVAGIFLLIRIFPLFKDNQFALTTCLCLGATTTFYAAMQAMTQNDIKKIVAYSTSGQLGLMMVAIGIGQPHLAFMHICTHAFFKAMMFLCSGVIIHNLDDEQDIRQMGGLQMVMPVTTSYFSIASFALMGTPFLAGFYSKDAIIEAANVSYVNFSALMMTTVATVFTAAYSLRLIYYVSMKSPRMNPLLKFNEDSTPVLKSITRLALGSIVAGLFIFYMTFPDNPTTHTMSPLMKLSALLSTLIGIISTYYMAKANWHLSPKHLPHLKLYSPAHYNHVMHRPIVIATLNTAWEIATHILDDMVHKKYPRNLSNLNMTAAQVTRASQAGLIKAYLAALFITLVIAMETTYLF